MAFIPDLSVRVDAPELMESGVVEDEELGRALRFLGMCNRWLGGWSSLEACLRRWSAGWDRSRPLTFLDVGTGGGDIPLRLLGWLTQRGFSAKVTAIDSDPAIVAWARRFAAGSASWGPALEVLEADLETLARSGRRFDYVLASLVLHHVPEPADALRACDALAERGLWISDLERGAAGYLGVRALTGLLGGRVERYDGPLSVRRAFRPVELEAAAREAGLSYAKVERTPFFRLRLAGEKA